MLQLFSTLTRQKEVFSPIQEKKVTMYICGITPYDTTHVGHAFTYISFDALVKYLTYKGYTVKYTQNVTDINDRDNDILKRAQEEGTTWEALSDYWTKKFLKDMRALNWTKPTNYIFASEKIPEMVQLIEQILANGYAYEVNGGVYLDVTTYDGYGKLSKLSQEEMITISKEFEEDLDNPDKKQPLDITLWKPASPSQAGHIPSFGSPWSKGRPGWHIECSTMSMSTLGEQIDIHGGGIDLMYPHHEAEITQSETATQKIPSAKYWMHVNLVEKNHEKMSKSKGNLVMVKDLLKKYSPNAIRWYLLSHHYRESWNFEEKELEEAEGQVKKLNSLFTQSSSWETMTSSEPKERNDSGHLLKELPPMEGRDRMKNLSSENIDKELLGLFEEAMNNDLNTPEALDIIGKTIMKQDLLPEEKKSLAIIAHTLGFRI